MVPFRKVDGGAAATVIAGTDGVRCGGSAVTGGLAPPHAPRPGGRCVRRSSRGADLGTPGSGAKSISVKCTGLLGKATIRKQ